MGKRKRIRPRRKRRPSWTHRAGRRAKWIGPRALAAIVVAAALFWLLRPRPHHGLPEKLVRGAAKGYNLLVLTLDTVRADHLGCYGCEEARTPAIDGLAANGVRFDDAVTPVPITLPSHATIFTGLDPPHHGARHNGEFRVRAEAKTMAEALAKEGYATAAFVSAFVLDERFGLARGFDHYDDDISVAAASALFREGNERSAGSVTQAAIEWLGARDRSRPFFAWVHYYDAHNPYLPPPPFAERFRDRPYDGEIAYMDSQIARLLDTIERTGAGKKTLIVVVADHGEGLGDHGESTHSMLIYETTMHVPLLLSCRGLFGGAYVAGGAVVSTADVFPTVMELLGIEDGGPVDGRSLLETGMDKERTIYMETLAPYFDNRWSPLYGLRRHGAKYILAPEPEFYDLAADPEETRNLARGRATADSLSAELSTMLSRRPSLENVAAGREKIDGETRRRLAALGYLGGDAGGGADTGEAESEALPDPKRMMPVLRNIDLANLHMRQGDLDRALAAIREAERRSPRNRNVLRTKGKILLFMEKDREAEKTLREADAIRPDADASLLLAQLCIKQKRFDEATAFLDRAATIDPNHGGVFIARGDLLLRSGKMEEAIAAYERAAKVDPYRVGDAARARIAAARRGGAQR